MTKKSGFTLIEVMIALVINSILLLGVVDIFIANLEHYRKVIGVGQLNEQLQSAMYSMSSEIRRAGYSGTASNDIGTHTNNNAFQAGGTDIAVTGGSCILFTYDVDGNGSLPAISSAVDDERYGFRLNNGAIQVRPAGATFACNAASSNWENMTDPTVITITNLSFTLNQTTVSSGLLVIRSVDISVTGQLVSDTSVTKTITAHVRLRNDKFI